MGKSATYDFSSSPEVEKYTETSESPSRKSPPSENNDPFVADDTFQDQGPGSVEMYKLDLLRERPLLNSTPISRLLIKTKSKTPKKFNHSSWRANMSENKTINSNRLHKQSNSFTDFSSEMPPDSDPFSVGGVPELQVGCEGLEASNHMQKRSIEFSNKNTDAVDLWPDVTPISLDLDYDLSTEDYEEMDELLKLKKLETTNMMQNRGDIEATLHSEFYEEQRRAEKLPVRGDLGKSDLKNESTINGKQPEDSFDLAGIKDSQNERLPSNPRRKILWFEDRKRSKREMWGFGKDEGVVSSAELETENQRRRQDFEKRRKKGEMRGQEQERRHKDTHRQDYTENRTNADIERIRSDYEKRLQQREEKRRQRQWSSSNSWQPQEDHRQHLQNERMQRWRDEERRGKEQPHNREEFRVQEEQRQQSRDEDLKRQKEERRLLEERRNDQSRWEVEARRRQEEMRHLEEQRREWMLKKQLENEPSNFLPMRASPSESRQTELEVEKERREKLRKYMQSNRPVIVNHSADRQREENRRMLEREHRKLEEQKLQEYIRRNQPIHVLETNRSDGNNWLENRRMDNRYPGPENVRRNHGPSAPTNINPRNYVDEIRRRDTVEGRIRERERQEVNQRRIEALRREEEVRRMQSRKYEEQRTRQETARLDAERRTKELIEEQTRQSPSGKTGSFETTKLGDRRRFEEPRRKQDASLIRSSLEPRRPANIERQKMELERGIIHNSEHQERTRAMPEQWQQQEEARLNALPVRARIILRPGGSSSKPGLMSRAGFDNDVGFPNNNRIATSPRPFPTNPPPCVWAVIQCCPTSTKRLVNCFETMGCAGIHWDPNPCRISIIQAAREQVMKFYEDRE
ncbi:Reticulocyte-binding protein 2 like protein a [Dufourea novaeangliae]|uniref:Reticulocyte-binding protein 2 like protein a n=1 Tax=Dufourea novaeangliae TaxID=178035 RepID=A0A154P1S0_DUFNO|nr:Reticulocyte-binding protein 2 like protein a [Dufourea novaeangliae]